MKPEKRRQNILDASIIVFGEKGYHKATVSDIIKKSNIARGTFYLYFRSKQDLFERVLESLLDDVDKAIKRITVNAGYESAMSQLYDNIDRVLDILTGDKYRAKILMHTAVGLEKGINKKLDEFYDNMLQMITRSLKLGQEIGLVRSVNVNLVSISILGSFKELLYHYSAGGETKRLKYSRESLIKELLDYNIRGLFNEKYFTK